jgi:hypothetical protein
LIDCIKLFLNKILHSAIIKFLKKEAVNNWTPPKLGLVDLFSVQEFDQWIKEQGLTMVNFYVFE